MTDPSLSPNVASGLTPAQMEKRYAACVGAMNFELEQFWKRSLFFLGFIAAAFVALAAIEENRHSLQAAIASFGFVAAYIWTLTNRGSRFRYENWKHKLLEVEQQTTGPLYVSAGSEKSVAPGAGNELGGGKSYVESKLIVAFSDYVVVFWIGIVFYKIVGVLLSLNQLGWTPFPLKHVMSLAFMAFSTAFAVIVGTQCRTTGRHEK